MNEGKLYNGQRISMVTNNTKLFAGTGPEDLATEQIGVFQQDGKTRFKGTRTPVKNKGRKFKIMQGFPNRYSALTSRAQLPSFPHQTVEFKAEQIVGWNGIAAKPFTKEPMVAVGYDGSDAAKTLSVKKGESVQFHLHLTGSPIHKLTNQRGWLHQEFNIEPDCLGDAEPGTQQACAKIQKAFLDQFERKTFGTIPLKTLVKATGVSTCDTPPSGLVQFSEYSIDVTDTGSEAALGRVQAQYPGKVVTRKSYADQISTYLVQTPSGAGNAPAQLSVSKNPVLPNCSTCPSGYTLVAQGSVFEVTVPNDTTPADQPGQISKTKIGGQPEEAVFQYVMPAAQDPAQFETNIKAGTGTASAEVKFQGLQRGLCTPPAAQTLSWTATGKTFSKAPADYTITLQDTTCGTSRLVELQARYGSGVSEDVDGQCTRRYKLTTYSDAVFDDSCGLERYKFVAPDAYDSIPWVPVVLTGSGTTGCSCGIILEGARFIRPVNEVTFPLIGYDRRDLEPVQIRVSAFSHDYTGPVCQTTSVPFTILQNSDYPVGFGRDVIETERDSLGYFLKEYTYHPIVRELYGDRFIAKPELYYDEYQLTVNTKSNNMGFFGETGFKIMYRFFFPVGQGKEFEAAINSLVASVDSDLSLVTL
ncbi:hypothetical protein CLV58_109165 [Spirosoma oryzae]|uniref:Uncharacterized protein n=1 Tax=Spirosoma oryzae TaxID=1469603 RepID=A0A2T0SYE7_9BACT|nr:hypothetical protein [Spirosoma oryzae]PRY38438.1 hypothetical protein CLV58_109165 [Spirosoma oryzae]